MPELPDVELFRREVERTCRGRVIDHIVVSDPGSVAGTSVAALQRALNGARVRAVRRHGKHLLLLLDPPAVLAMQFGTNGSVRFLAAAEAAPPYVRLRLDFAGGDRLAYLNPRRIGRVRLAPDPAAFVAAAGLGPDVLDPGFDAEAFAAALDGRQAVKTALTDQARMAGIGNIYADESLFQAGIHPGAAVRALDGAQRRRLFATIRHVLQSAIEGGLGAEAGRAQAPAGWLLTERHPDGRCPRCGAKLCIDKHGTRTGYFCPRCQPVVADGPSLP